MRHAPVGEPEVLVEPSRVDFQRLARPLTDSPPVVQRVVVISPDLPLMGASVQVNDTVIVVSATNQHENTLPVRVFHELHTVGLLELARPTRRLAVDELRVVLQEPLLTHAV